MLQWRTRKKVAFSTLQVVSFFVLVAITDPPVYRDRWKEHRLGKKEIGHHHRQTKGKRRISNTRCIEHVLRWSPLFLATLSKIEYGCHALCNQTWWGRRGTVKRITFEKEIISYEDGHYDNSTNKHNSDYQSTQDLASRFFQMSLC